MRGFFAALLLTAVLGCQTSESQADIFERTVQGYNQHLRWKRFEKASRFLPEDVRKQFLVTFEKAEDTLNIDDLEVKDVDFQQGGTRAKVTIEAHYYELPSVTLEKKRWVQEWELKGDQWWLVSDPKGPFFNAAASAPSSQPAK